MKSLAWVVVAIVLDCVMAWIVFGPLFTKNPVALSMIVAIFLGANLGTIWMLYVSVRYEEHPLPFAMLAFVPYSFLWYYSHRVRSGRHLTKRAARLDPMEPAGRPGRP